MSQTTASEVFTLEEVTDYLKLPLDTIEREASQGHIPGRRIEDTWRFLKSAIDDGCAPKTAVTSCCNKPAP